MLAFGNMLQQKKCMHCSEFSIERVDAKLIPAVACLTFHLYTPLKQQERGVAQATSVVLNRKACAISFLLSQQQQ